MEKQPTLYLDLRDRTGELVLSPLSGLLAGIVGSVLISCGIVLLKLIANITVIGPLTLKTENSIVNLLIYSGVDGILGVLYALSAQNGPKHAMIAVGLYYGFFLWILWNIIAGVLLDSAARSMLHSWSFLLASLVFGLWLAVVALFSAKYKPYSRYAPKD